MQEYLIYNSDRLLAAKCWAESPEVAVGRMYETGEVETEFASSTWLVAVYDDIDPDDNGVKDGDELPPDAPHITVFHFEEQHWRFGHERD